MMEFSRFKVQKGFQYVPLNFVVAMLMLLSVTKSVPLARNTWQERYPNAKH
jgi:hypothetical protein